MLATYQAHSYFSPSSSVPWAWFDPFSCSSQMHLSWSPSFCSVAPVLSVTRGLQLHPSLLHDQLFHANLHSSGPLSITTISTGLLVGPSPWSSACLQEKKGPLLASWLEQVPHLTSLHMSAASPVSSDQQLTDLAVHTDSEAAHLWVDCNSCLLASFYPKHTNRSAPGFQFKEPKHKPLLMCFRKLHILQCRSHPCHHRCHSFRATAPLSLPWHSEKKHIKKQNKKHLQRLSFKWQRSPSVSEQTFLVSQHFLLSLRYGIY